METISISGFGGFKEAKFETAPIMVFIGEQATGKSIVAKLLYFFRNLGANPPVLRHDSEEHGRKWCREEFSTLFPPEDWGLGGFEIRYECNEQSVRISHPAKSEISPNAVEIEWSRFYSGAWEKWSQRLTEVKSVFEHGDVAGSYARTLRLHEEVRKDVEESLGAESAFEQVFVPAGRGFFAQISENIFTMLASNQGDVSKSFDPFLLRFGSLLQYYKKNFKSLGFFEARTTSHGRFPSVREYVENILKAEYVRENGQDILLHPDGRRVELRLAASGQQESLPLLLTLGRVLAGGHDPGRSVYFEEPEAHLFPNAQRQIVELLAAAFNLRRDRVRFVITTHSPYILSVLDNLLQAGQRYASPKPDKKIGKIVPQVFALRPGDVAVYSLGNGQARLIMDPETKLIEADIIDNVSMEIDEQFHRLPTFRRSRGVVSDFF